MFLKSFKFLAKKGKNHSKSCQQMCDEKVSEALFESAMLGKNILPLLFAFPFFLHQVVRKRKDGKK